MIILQVIFWLCVLMVFHSYVLFPFLLKWLSAHQRKNQSIKNNNTPAVSVIMAAFNEEAVIGQKLESILQSKYPIHLTEILIGSDCSTDNTENIVLQYAQQHPNIYLYPFTKRQGKANIINQLVGKAKGDILILSDANVMFASDTISQLIIPFADNSVGLVDTRMVNTNIKAEGISFQEKSYISREVSIKNREGILWGTMMGPFGGCYAIRRELYRQVPSNLLVDDFYICMTVLEQGYKAVNNLKAIVYEDVSNDLGIEFRRKIRIATGDFQNLRI
ncbi:MAG TPA: glycosyltransferase, partial [Bacteroidales bacterium]|nr:glycosyltransferase [Bacteroidales bacterium]